MSTHTSEDKGPQLNAVCYVFLVLSTIAVLLRFCGRMVAHNAGFWWDDWLSLASLPFVWAMCGVVLYNVTTGLGKHIDQISGSHSELAKLRLIVDLIYNTGLTVIKMSVLLFYVRVFRIVVHRFIFWIVAFLIIGWGISTNFMSTFSCVPVHKAWDSTVPGHCSSLFKSFLGTAIPNIVIDFILLVLPVPILWRLHMKIPSKIALVAVFSAGYCVLVLSILRLTSITGLGEKAEKDMTYYFAYPTVVVVTELSTAFISSCMPAGFTFVRHVIRTYLPNLFVKYGSSKPLSRVAGAPIGPPRNPVEENRHKGFIKLGSGRGGTAGSNETLFDVSSGTVHYTNAYSGQIGDGKEVDEEGGIPLHQIHVRDDVHVHGLSGRNDIERSVDHTVLDLE